MAIFLVRAGFNDLLSVTAPTISSVSPNSGKPGNTVTVALTGLNTHFAQGSTTVIAGGGVTAGIPTVTSATALTVTLTIPQGVVQGTVSTLPTITSFSPTHAPIGTSITPTGTGLVSSA